MRKRDQGTTKRAGGATGEPPGVGVPRPAYIRHGRDQTESIVGLSMTADGSIVTRDIILEQREAYNRMLRQEFEQYLELHRLRILTNLWR